MPFAEEALRVANALLRRVVEAKDAELAAERAARERLELRVAELERRLGMDSTNSGTPTSKESIEAAARRRRGGRRRSGLRSANGRTSASPAGRGGVAVRAWNRRAAIRSMTRVRLSRRWSAPAAARRWPTVLW
jgi:hypothetical protein